MEGKYTGTRYVHAKGEIQAKVWYSKKEKQSLVQEQKIETGQQESAYSLKIHNLEINLSKKLPNFKNYDTISENKKLKLFSNFYLPFEWCKKTYQEYEMKEVTYEVEQMKQKLEEQIKKELEEQIPNKENIINTQVNYKEENGEVEVEVIYEVLETIGTKEKI